MDLSPRARQLLVVWPRAVLGWLGFRLLQFVVGCPFIVVILLQIAVATVIRWFSTPATLGKVEAGRRAYDRVAAAAAAGGSDAQELTRSQQPMLVFPEPDKGHDSLAWQLVGPYMRKYGRHAIANSQLFNPEYIHFFVPGVGSLAFVMADVWNRVTVIGTGEPLADRAAWRSITQLFLQEFPEAYFYHITEEYADLLHDMGYYINGCGTETTLQVQSWAYSARTRTIRSSARSARDSGVRVRELKPEELTDDMRLKLQHDVTGCWMQRKAIADRELRVFVRGVDYDNLELRDGIRVFVAEAFDPAVAPPANVDPVLQGAALNAKPPKPPRRNRSLKSQASAPLFSQLSGKVPLSQVNSAPALPAAAALRNRRQASSTGDLQHNQSSPAGGIERCAEPDGAAATAAVAAADVLASNEASSDSGNSSGSDCVARLQGLDTDADSSPTAVTAARSKGKDAPGKLNSSSSSDVSFGLRLEDSANLHEQQPSVVIQAAAADAAAHVSKAALAGKQSLTARKQQASGTAAEAPAAAPAAAVLAAPELVGFVLLDPLWEDEQEVGCVTSIMRAKRSAHQGTLKLLIEDIISTLRKEGKRELTFGFAPLFNVNDSSGRSYIHWIRGVSLYLFYCANNVYAFKNLAFSKTRYGAGLNAAGTAFNDPNVQATHVYLAVKHYTPGWAMVELFSFFKFVGIVDAPISVFLKLLGLKKGGENLK